jgi:hypothetical protein
VPISEAAKMFSTRGQNINAPPPGEIPLKPMGISGASVKLRLASREIVAVITLEARCSKAESMTMRIANSVASDMPVAVRRLATAPKND